jgi:lycopene cyclase domain-containing protein
MNLYLLVNLSVIFAPLALSFDRRVSFYRQWRAVLPAVLLVAALFIAEDITATARGHWDFAPEYAGEYRLLGIPPGEWLFFMTVPFACIFIYACVRSYQREAVIPFPRVLNFLFAALALVTAVLFRDQGYTRSVMIINAAAWLSLGILRPDLPKSRQFWTGMGITYLTFVLVNGLLTGIPVVTYGAAAIWGVRLGTIPLEDFFYSFALLTLNFVLYRLLLDRGRSPSPGPGLYVGPAGSGETASPPAAYRFMEKR